MMTRVWNETQDKQILGQAQKCSSYLCRLRGLTFRRCLDQDEGLWLVGQRESRVDAAIHMLFVFFPIAAIWLDQNGRVVDAKLALPFRPYYGPRDPAKDILEGPPSLLEKVRVGDRLRFEEIHADE
jgi:uncharacterized membrane protein (UPF0127 family)